ncbi:Terpene synthase, N-terminal domain [Nostoc flagelliforme CCNUN1]|uniref:Terpene synthase, N-terminal domain n=1 Tax=Nostoc flagelliforme CCNUN1 TaxID=2038116 RepID=A0A2K8T1F8_9NOSO|nr:hypothetical protein [Nostoc flagelliforme]AUB40825.1 Terpene synthase, N-terminal domain [Nostoc flagelliforme CCNUN1]
MDIISLQNKFKQSVKEELRVLEVTQLSNEAELILENMISSATQTLLEDRIQNQQSDDKFNEKVNDALKQIKLFISEAYNEQIQIEQNQNIISDDKIYLKSPKDVLLDVKRISKSAFDKAKDKLCPIYPFC